MTTLKQEFAAQKMVENGGNISKAMVDAGYSVNTAKTPQKLTTSKGFIELCESYGLTEDLLVNSLVEDIMSKKGNRKQELELGFKVRGLLVQKTDITSGNEVVGLISESDKKHLMSLLVR